MTSHGANKGTTKDYSEDKPPQERSTTTHKGLEPLHRSTTSFRTIAEPPTSRGAAYLRNSVIQMKGEEKRDYSKAEQFRMKRRCNSIKAPSDSDIRTLEVGTIVSYYVITSWFGRHIVFP